MDGSGRNDRGDVAPGGTQWRRTEVGAISRYLVTGGAGFIGSHLVERLIEEGHEVVVLDDLSTGRRENLSPFQGRFRFIEGTILDPETCAQAMRGVDFVLHQAALGSVPRSVAEPVHTHDVNLTGTLILLVAARDAGIRRFVYAGSSSAYGDTSELPKAEHMAPTPLSPYAVSKLGGEEYCRAFHVTYGMETILLRYFNVFGPRQDPASPYAAVIPLFAKAALEGRAPTINGDGRQSRDFTYVTNVVQANLLACEASSDAVGETFNIGCGERVTINDLWRGIRALVGSAVEAVHGPQRPGDVRHSLAAVDRARALLGYEPEVDLREGLRRSVEWYRQH